SSSPVSDARGDLRVSPGSSNIKPSFVRHEGIPVQTQAAVLFERNRPWSIETIELDTPKATEVLVELHASGMCHSDDHLVTGDMPIRLPCIGGHEGAGVVIDGGKHGSAPAPGCPR